MTKIIESLKPTGLKAPMTRGTFLKYAGATAAATTIVLAGCSDDDSPSPSGVTVNLGSGDIGILNYAYLLEQLEAAFYTMVVANYYTGITDAEKTILSDIKGHELIHRDFFKAALGTSAIAEVTFNFSTVDFTSRTAVLTTAKVFEDLGVSAYNGAGKLIVDPGYLLLAGKIVSVEARHASAISDLLLPFTAAFASDNEVTTDKGLDGARTPTEVLTAAGAYVNATVVFSSLPS